MRTSSWAGVQEHSAVSEPVPSGQDVYAGVPFRQWLSPNGQWRVRPIRCVLALVSTACIRHPEKGPCLCWL